MSWPDGYKPDAYAVMHQDIHPVDAAIGEEISTVRLRRTEHCNHPSQRGLGTDAHVHRFSGEPDGVDADQWANAHPSGSQVGHFTVTDCSPRDSSMIANASAGRLSAALKGTKAGGAAAD